MWPQIYDFFTRYTGVSYDFATDIQEIANPLAFISPRIWAMKINMIMTNLESAMDCIDEFGDNLTDDMPSKSDLKKIISQYVLRALLGNLAEVKRILHIMNVDVSSFEDFEMQVELLKELLVMLVENSLDDILSKNLFETESRDDEDDDNQFVEVFGLHQNDVPNMSMTVQSIRQDYFESLDDDNE